MNARIPTPPLLNKWTIASFCSAILLQASATFAAEYYVSPTGADSNPGSLSLPWKTIKKATSLLAAGDTAYIRAGTYNEDTITFANSGAADRRITLKAYPGETPIIDAGYTAPPLDGTRRTIFWINNKSHITIDGLTLTRAVKAGVYIGEDSPGAVGITVQNCDIHDIVVLDNTSAIYLANYAYGAVIRGNTLRPETTGTTRGSGVEIFTGGNDHIIENNDISKALRGVFYKHGAIQGSGNDLHSTLVRNNRIHDIFSTAGGVATGIETTTDRMQIINNVLYNVSGYGIRVYEEVTCDRSGAFYTAIDHNTILSASSGIILYSPSSSCPSNGARHSEIHDNLIYKTSTDSQAGLAIWIYTTKNAYGAHDTRSDYNLVYATDTANVWRLYGTRYASVAAWSAALTEDTGTPQDAHSLQAAPLFTDLYSHDYSLAAGSPGKNAASDGADMGADVRAVGLHRALDALPPAAPMRLRTE